MGKFYRRDKSYGKTVGYKRNYKRDRSKHSLGHRFYKLTDQLYRVRQVVDLAAITQSASADVFQGYYFRASDVDQITSFSTVFDIYRIDKVIVHFEPLITQYIDSTGGSGQRYNSMLYTVIDYDDITSITKAQMRQYSGCVETNGCKAIKRYCVPRALFDVDRAGTTTPAGIGKTHQWLDMVDTGVPHYGMKVLLEQAAVAGTTVLQKYRVWAEYFLSFKHIR